MNVVGKNPSTTPPIKRRRGRPHVWSKSIKLHNLFDEFEHQYTKY
jgi:hypothetical protein